MEEIDAIAVEMGPRYGPLVLFAAQTGLRTNEWIALERRDIDRGRGLVSFAIASPTASTIPTRRPIGRRAAHAQRGGRARPPDAEDRHTARVPCAEGRLHRPGQLADARVVSGARSGWPPPARSVCAAPHLRDRGARRRGVRRSIWPDHGLVAGDDRAPLWPPPEGDPGPSPRPALPAWWRFDGVARATEAEPEVQKRPLSRQFLRSGRRDSNSRHPAWEADALPTELRPRDGRF